MLPNIIEIEISEVDRQTAEEFNDCTKCLIVTALMNRGYNAISCSPYHVYIDSYENNGTYELETKMGPRELFKDYNASKKPFYQPKVVGLKIRMSKLIPNPEPIQELCQKEPKLIVSTRS